MQTVGNTYLQEVLTDHIAAVISEPHSLEVSQSSISLTLRSNMKVRLKFVYLDRSFENYRISSTREPKYSPPPYKVSLGKDTIFCRPSPKVSER